MSKYIYTTIYEQFTGLKPPEPKNHKPRRRRGYGHPYRMRLNIQDDAQPEEMLDDEDMPEDLDQQPQSFLSPSASHPTVRKPVISKATHTRRTPQSHNPRAMQHSPIIQETTCMHEPAHKTETAPKVTYKKRRQYNDTSIVPLLTDN